MENQETKPLKKHLMSYWLTDEEEALLKEFTPIYGSRSHLGRTSLMEKLFEMKRQQRLAVSNQEQKAS